eukprot:4510304-Pyramimonas_sp.AAC.1
MSYGRRQFSPVKLAINLCRTREGIQYPGGGARGGVQASVQAPGLMRVVELPSVGDVSSMR